jgi:hypothetical protein
MLMARSNEIASEQVRPGCLLEGIPLLWRKVISPELTSMSTGVPSAIERLS